LVEKRGQIPIFFMQKARSYIAELTTQATLFAQKQLPILKALQIA